MFKNRFLIGCWSLRNVRKKTSLFIVAAIVGSLTFFLGEGSHRAHAGFLLSMSLDGGPSAFTVMSGQQSADIPVYLLQTGGENRLNTIGLFAAGATLTFDIGAGNVQYQSNSGRLAPHWDDLVASKVNFDAVSASLQLQGLTNTFVRAAVGSNAVQIGTFRVIGGTVGTTTNVGISLQGLVSDPILLNDANLTKILPNATNPADRLSFGSGTITSVPEPTSLWMTGVVFAALQGIWYARRKDTTSPRRPSRFTATT